MELEILMLATLPTAPHVFMVFQLVCEERDAAHFPWLFDASSQCLLVFSCDNIDIVIIIVEYLAGAYYRVNVDAFIESVEKTNCRIYTGHIRQSTCLLLSSTHVHQFTNSLASKLSKKIYSKMVVK